MQKKSDCGSTTRKLPTSGLTNQAVSHSISDHLFLTYLCTSLPANSIKIASSNVGGVDLIRLSIVTSHSLRDGRQAGRFDGEGGAPLPVKPQRPSWSMRAL